ncbi:energy-coupling factor transporter transmembrane protein EcfT [Gracilibacillus halotolerans]|uniref:Energy-coupling factor transporter transmembrane protein EcfT n=1 Tax=Gracilibacillus halotolerans TaxID=74386 RepID=A0A841RMG0_9BACI|nr:hypothetical protein [Gracilibacillus halotolerans]MBB6512813.1 energy-coupling factor transporter transmembrane protein EcfT [Gracilibacillus halotolerans]
MKYFYHGLIIFSLSILLCGIYYIFFSQEKYSGSTPFLPSIPFSIIVVITFVLSFIYAKKLFLFKWPLSTIVAILAVILLFVSSNWISTKYGYILQDYYNKTHYQTLIGLPQYANQTGNFISVKQLYEKDYHKVNHIIEGREGDGQDSYLQVYFVNEQDYIIVDWETDTIDSRYTKREVEEMFLAENPLENIDWITHNGRILYVVQNGSATNYLVLPTENGFYFPSLAEYEDR